MILCALGGGTRDEEPLVNAWVNWSRSQVLTRGNVGKLVRTNTAGRMLDSNIGTVNKSVQEHP
jgi:hypothetical protein